MTLGKYIDYYIYDILIPSNYLKRSTINTYIVRTFTIKSSFLNEYPLYKIRKEHLQKFFTNLQENHSVNYTRSIKTFLSSVFKNAEEDELILKNYVSLIKIKDNRKEIKKDSDKILTSEEVEKLLKYLYNNNLKLYYIIKILVNTGLRINELLALTEEDFNLKENFINVNKNLSYNRNLENKKCSFLLTTPKTKQSFRKVYFNKDLGNDIKKFISHIKSLYLKNGIKYNKKSILFINSNFSYYNYSNLKFCLDNSFTACGINKRGFHIFRHTYISKLNLDGINKKIIQEQVGHTDQKMVMHYTHIEDKYRHTELQKLKVF